MEKEGLILLKESSAGISLAVFMIMGLILFILVSAVGDESNPQQAAVAKLNKKEKQLKEKEETLRHVEKQLKMLK
jgi:large-conductance mechanosensitive channel